MTGTVVIVTPVVNTVDVPGAQPVAVVRELVINTVNVPDVQAVTVLRDEIVNVVETPAAPVVAVVLQELVQVVTAGLQGPAGPGAAIRYTHTQALAAQVWTVPHNLSSRPSVTVTDNLGAVLAADVQYVDEQIVRVTHGAALTGYVFCN